jgi:myxalamid-type nonribosomal peptide synthetase MxaA
MDSLVAPRTPLEEEVAQAFALVLNIDQIDIHKDFFSLGGNSLLVARLASRLSSMYKIDLPVHQIFREPTVAGVAHVIEVYRREKQGSINLAWNALQLEKEVVLESSITPTGLPVGRILDPAGIFLTGVTGYLGAFLLNQLLLETHAEIFCLVRATTSEDGMKRIKDILKRYLIWDETYAKRIHPVVGDLSRPLLGCDPLVFAELAAKTDVIYHCGALVNFVYPYAALKGPNVLGTQEVLRLACTSKVKAVHYISTIDVFLTTHAQRPFLEHDLSRQLLRIPDGYPLSKWVSEAIITIGRSRGVPLCVYRPGIMLSHTCKVRLSSRQVYGLKTGIPLRHFSVSHQLPDPV